MRTTQDNRPSVAMWLKMAAGGGICAVALALVTGQWNFLWDSLPVLGLCLILGGIRYVAQLRENAAHATQHQNPKA